MKPGEGVIVCAAMLDATLADLIASALRDDKKETEDFVGLDADGRAPLGSFGSRIQAAYLMNLISKRQLDVLRCIKDIRNDFSHNVSASFAQERTVKKVRRIYEIYRDFPGPRKKNRTYTSAEEFAEAIEKTQFSAGTCGGIFIGAAMGELKRIHESCRRKIGAQKRLATSNGPKP